MENKEAIIKALVEVLKLTRIGQNVMDGDYWSDGNEELAILYIEDLLTGKPHHFQVNITADSGLSVIKDILYALET